MFQRLYLKNSQRNKTLFYTFILLTISLLIFPLVSAQTIVVNQTSIQEAISNSSDGDTIYVLNGNYTEQLFINKSITILGEDYNNTKIIMPSNPHALSSGGLISNVLIYSNNYSEPNVNVSISNLTIDGNNKSYIGVFVYSANASIDSSIIKNYQINILVNRLWSQPMNIFLNLTNSLIEDYGFLGIQGVWSDTEINLYNNKIYGHIGSENYTNIGIYLQHGATGNIIKNDIQGNYENFTYYNGTNSTTANFSNGDIGLSGSTGIWVSNSPSKTLNITGNAIEVNSNGIRFLEDSQTEIKLNYLANNFISVIPYNLSNNNSLNLSYNYWGAEPLFSILTLGFPVDAYYLTTTLTPENLNTYVAPTPPSSSSSSSSSSGGGGGGGGGSSYVKPKPLNNTQTNLTKANTNNTIKKNETIPKATIKDVALIKEKELEIEEANKNRRDKIFILVGVIILLSVVLAFSIWKVKNIKES